MSTNTDDGVGVTPFELAARAVALGAEVGPEAERLVAEMTVDERLGCLDGDLDCWPGMADMVVNYHTRPWPAAAVPRLGIPGIAFSDGPRGVVIGRATAFPVSMARGATFDVDLEERIGEAIGAELRASGATFYGGICVNLLRHPSWGRAQETYGEDPFHVGELGAALCRGVQRHVMACVKHFACNSMENARFRVDVKVDERSLHEVYLPHFRRVVEEGVASVMTAYNRVNGDWCGESAALLTDVLRDRWSFEGFTITDFVFGLRDPVASVGAGLDIEMPFRQQRAAALPSALEDGRLNQSDVDRCAQHVVGTLLRFASVFDPATDPMVGLANPAHRALAREAAAKAIVILKNDAGVLPLDVTPTRRIALVGALASEVNLGDRGSSDVIASDVVTIADGMREAFGDERVMLCGDASEIDPDDLAVVVVGRTYRDEGEYTGGDATADLVHLLTLPPEVDLSRLAPQDGDDAEEHVSAGVFGDGGDRIDLGLSRADLQLVRHTASVASQTVVVLMGGSAILTSDFEDEVAAIVHVWYPGMEGGAAAADVLSGRVNASGKLPFAIPRSLDDLVPFERDADETTYGLLHGQWYLDSEGVKASWPFGWGLSYTSFELRDLEVTHDAEHTTVSVYTANTGDRDGDDIVFIFAGLPDSAHLRPLRRLVGFARQTVPAGDEQRVEITVANSSIALWLDGSWVLEPGNYAFTAAHHAGDPAALESTARIG